MSRRNGKIARLPKEIRTHVNRMLDDGADYDSIIAWLASEGHAGFNHENISNWYSGGYLDWCREQDRREQIQLQREWTDDFLHYHEGERVSEAASNLIATHLADALERFDRAKLASLMANDPKTYFKVVSQFLQLRQSRLKQKQLENAEIQSNSNQIKPIQTNSK